ncbi:MAG: class I SAM-dependent methyltransferase [Balneolaceae bacterium]|nr:class I SAM-dependent methyltransferase [Balneolaceae bacterium]
MTENEIQEFWQKHPCGDAQVGGLSGRHSTDYEKFFQRYDSFRYEEEKHILQCLDGINFNNKKVLEVGLGQGADSEQIIRRGAIWSGLDLTNESVHRTQTRLQLRRLPYDTVKQGNVLNIPFSDNNFDIVFSHGVLHHVPDIKQAQKEISRILKPNGELIIMVYSKWSLNYILSIGLIRRMGLFLLNTLGMDPGGIYSQHLANAHKLGIWQYLRMENFIHYNTDGPLNPYSKVYDIPEIKKDFPDFIIIKSYKRFMHAPPLPVRFLPLDRLLGWHLWVHLHPIKKI